GLPTAMISSAVTSTIGICSRDVARFRENCFCVRFIFRDLRFGGLGDFGWRSIMLFRILNVLCQGNSAHLSIHDNSLSKRDMSGTKPFDARELLRCATKVSLE